MRTKLYLTGAFVILLIIFFIVANYINIPIDDKFDVSTVEKENNEYSPLIEPTAFTTTINNPYFNLPIGRELIYEGQTEDGIEKIVISITGETKEIMGVKTLVYRDKVYINEELVEDTKDYLAQDAEGNVWYFGEDVDNYENGEVIDHAGGWIAAVDGAQPGIWIKVHPLEGDSYRQEYYQDTAEDMRDVVKVGEVVSIGMGSYNDCVKMYDWTPLESKSREYKYYCAEVGAMVLEVDLETGKTVELIQIN